MPDPTQLPLRYVRLPVRLHPEYYAYLRNQSVQTHLSMADLVRGLIHCAPENLTFQVWVTKHTSQERMLLLRDWQDQGWGPLL